MPKNTTDEGELRVLGETPWMMVFTDPNGSPSTNVSVWHVTLSPQGPGHALFWRSDDLTNGEARIYSDNIALARWLQGEILFGPYKDLSLPIVEAEFTRLGSIPWFITERVEAKDELMEFTWYDLLEGHAGHSAPDPANNETHGHYAVYVPARQVRVTLNGKEAKGVALERERDGRPSSTCFLALAESWQRYS